MLYLSLCTCTRDCQNLTFKKNKMEDNMVEMTPILGKDLLDLAAMLTDLNDNELEITHELSAGKCVWLIFNGFFLALALYHRYICKYHIINSCKIKEVAKVTVSATRMRGNRCTERNAFSAMADLLRDRKSVV